MNTSKASQLNGRVAFRSLTGGHDRARNKTIKVSVPQDMIWALEWTADNPIRIELMDDGSLRMTQVNAEEYDLEITNSGWKKRGRR